MQGQLKPTKVGEFHRITCFENVFEVAGKFGQVLVANCRLVLNSRLMSIGFLHFKNTVEDVVRLLEGHAAIKVAVFSKQNSDKVARQARTRGQVRRFLVILAILVTQANVETTESIV